MAPYIYDIYKECDTLYELRAYMSACLRVRVYACACACEAKRGGA